MNRLYILKRVTNEKQSKYNGKHNAFIWIVLVIVRLVWTRILLCNPLFKIPSKALKPKRRKQEKEKRKSKRELNQIAVS